MYKDIFKGIAHLKLFNQEADGTETLVEERRQHNIITIEGVKRLLSGNEVFADSGVNIGISTDATAENFERTTLGQLYAIGDPSLVAQGYIYTPENPGVEPASVIHTNRFIAPANARTIESLGMVVGNPNQNLGGTGSATCYTHLKLASPLNQGTTQVLEISYKLFINWQNVNLSPVAKKFFEDLFLGYYREGANTSDTSALDESNLWSSIATPFSRLSFYTYHTSIQAVINLLQLGLVATDVDPGTGNPDYVWSDKQGGRLKYRALTRSLQSNVDGRDLTGLAIRGVVLGAPYYAGRAVPSELWNPEDFGADNDNINDWFALAPFNKNTNLSNVYSHTEDATTFFYDGNKLANSSWKPTITEDSSTNFPTSYIIKVTTSGGVGVGEYKIYSTSFDNSYWQGNYKAWGFGPSTSQTTITYANPFPLVSNQMAGTVFDVFENGYDDFIYNHRWIYTWSDTQGNYQFATFQRDKGIGLLELTHDSYTALKTYKLGDYPALGARINDLAVNPSLNRIYIAADGGLHYIDTTNDTLTTLNGDRCVAVDIGFSDAVVAVFADGVGGGRLSSSFGTNFATALDLTGATINWDNISRVVIDPDSTDYELCIAEGYGPKHGFTVYPSSNITNAIKYHWCSNANTIKWVRTDGYDFDNNVSEYYHDIGVWPTNNSIAVKEGLWIYPGLRGHKDRWGGNSDAWNVGAGAHNVTNGCFDRDFANDVIAIGGTYESYHLYTTSSSLYKTWNSGINLGDAMGGGEYILASFSTIYGAFELEACSFCDWIRPKLSTDGTSYSVILQFGHGTMDPSTAAYQSISNYVVTNQMRGDYLVKIDVDESSPSATINTNYNKLADSTGSFAGVLYGPPNTAIIKTCNWRVTNTKHILGFSPANDKVNSGSIYQLTHLRNPQVDLNDNLLQAYKWTGSAWVKDDDNTGPGKPLHTATEALVEGLSISWTDLQPGDSQDLIAGQYYTFVRTTGEGMIVVDDFTPTFDIGADVYIRPVVDVTGESVAPNGGTGQYFVGASPSGLSSDPNWLTLPDDNEQTFSIDLNGTPANVIYDPSTTVNAGDVHVTDPALGELYFNTTDAMSSITMDYTYLNKFDDTEVL